MYDGSRSAHCFQLRREYLVHHNQGELGLFRERYRFLSGRRLRDRPAVAEVARERAAQQSAVHQRVVCDQHPQPAPGTLAGPCTCAPTANGCWTKATPSMAVTTLSGEPSDRRLAWGAPAWPVSIVKPGAARASAGANSMSMPK
eukprot:scaffold43821_cov56-Phaeocystis_antarctica.AAC.3